eukprot:gene8320-5058_t
MLYARNGVREARHAAETLLSIVVVHRAARRGVSPGVPHRE